MKISLHTIIILLGTLLLGNAGDAYAEEKHMLLAKTGDKIMPLNRGELRRLFLGMPVYRKGKQLKPLINKHDGRCYQIFLQSVLGMSQKTYERTVSSNGQRQGYHAPVIYSDLNKLVTEMNNNSQAISIIYEHSELRNMPFTIVQEIWTSDVN